MGSIEEGAAEVVTVSSVLDGDSCKTDVLHDISIGAFFVLVEGLISGTLPLSSCEGVGACLSIEKTTLSSAATVGAGVIEGAEVGADGGVVGEAEGGGVVVDAATGDAALGTGVIVGVDTEVEGEVDVVMGGANTVCVGVCELIVCAFGFFGGSLSLSDSLSELVSEESLSDSESLESLSLSELLSLSEPFLPASPAGFLPKGASPPMSTSSSSVPRAPFLRERPEEPRDLLRASNCLLTSFILSCVPEAASSACAAREVGVVEAELDLCLV